MWDTIIEMLHHQAGGDPEHVHRKQIPKRQEPFGDIDCVYLEDHEAVIKTNKQRPKSTMRHVSRTHRVALDWSPTASTYIQ